MESISYAIASADKLNQFIHAEIRATDNKTGSPRESSDAQAAKYKATSALNNTIHLVNNTLSRLRSIPNPCSSSEKPVPFPYAPHVAPQSTLKVSQLLGNGDLKDGDQSSIAKSLIKSMSADTKSGLGSQVKSLKEMATSIEPIVDNFNDKKPYLDKFSATLNTVPVVGIKNNQIMYLATQQDTFSPGGTKDVWTYFSALPNGANVTSSSNVHFFPYKGDFCLSVGASVWRKRHRTPEDPILQQAVGNWPKLYLDEWQKIGDNAFPGGDIKDVIPFAVLSADRNVIDFKLLILKQDGSIQVLTKDDIYESNSWSTLSYSKVSDAPAAPPKWTRCCYWNNTVIALDDQNNIWNLNVKFESGTYTISEKTQIDPTSELTATDIGPVVVHSDGYLYKRYVQDPPSDGSEPKLLWTRWVHQEGVTKLGVASPGVLLDLLTLTKSLKSRYIETQAGLYPVVNKINAFAVTHQSYLSLLMKAANDWAEADTDQKQAQAVGEGKKFVNHAKVWAKILNTSILGTKETVNIMTAQLQDVKGQLETQLQLLRDKLRALQNTLAVQKESLSKLTAAFWGTVAAMLLGVALGIIAIASGVGTVYVVGAGALFVAGFVATIALAVKMSELAGEISHTESQIDTVTKAIDELSSVVQNFTDLDKLYGTLNVFWGRMAVDANTLSTMNEATAEQLGADVLADPSSIIAAQGVTTEISDAAKIYLDTLNKQGIIIQPPTMLALTEYTPTIRSVTKAVSIPSIGRLESMFDAAVSKAQDFLVTGDFDGYEKLMEKAFTVEVLETASRTMDRVESGVWYDIPSLSDAARLYNNSALRAASLANTQALDFDGLFAESSSSTVIENRIKASTPVVVAMLHKTNAMCSDIQKLLEAYKAAKGNKADIDKLRDDPLKKAIDDCVVAQQYAARANNAFVDVNHAAVDYQNGPKQQVNTLQTNARSARASAEEQKRDISIPWWVYLGGAAGVLAYMEGRKGEIEKDLNNRLNQINSSIHQLELLEQSGALVNGHSATWIEMVQTISSCLAEVINILTAIFGQVLEDPTMYDALLNIEWSNIAKNTQDVLNILASRGIDVGSSALAISHATVATSQDATKKVVESLSGPNKLDTLVQGQAQQANDFFADMEKLLRSPYLSGIVGYWDQTQVDKTSLLDVLTRLKTQYVDMMSSQYPVVENLYTTSLLQEVRASLVVDKKLSLDVLVQSSLRSARTNQKTAQVAADKFRAASADYTFALAQVKANLDQIQTKLADVDKQIGELEKKERDLIIQLIADVVALSLASVTLLAGYAMLGPLTLTLTAAQAIGLGATATAAAIKGSIDSLQLADIVTLLSVLKSTKRDLDSAFHGLSTIQPIFRNVVNAAQGFEDTTTTMADGLQALQDDLDLLQQVKLTQQDVEEIGNSWSALKVAALTWIDTVNRQGIVAASP